MTTSVDNDPTHVIVAVSWLLVQSAARRASCVGVAAAFLVCWGCGNSGPQHPPSTAATPPAQPVATTASTGACAAVLQSIQAGGNVIVNVRCDEPTELKILSAISEGAWTGSSCPYLFPAKGWKYETSIDSSTLLPVAGSYFAQFDFRFGIQRLGMSQMEFIYVYGNRDEVIKRPPAVTAEDYASMSQLAKNYPVENTRIPAEAIDQLRGDDGSDMAHREKTTNMLSFRRKVQLEDGQEFAVLKEPIFKNNSRWSTGTTLLDGVQTYPSWGEDAYNQTTDFSCSATSDMNIKTFSALCAMLLEKQTLEADSLDPQNCDNSTSAESVTPRVEK